MDYIYWLFGYDTGQSVITETVYKNKDKMNNIQTQILTFDKSKLNHVYIEPESEIEEIESDTESDFSDSSYVDVVDEITLSDLYERAYLLI